MKSKKIIAGLLSLTLLSFSAAVPVSANCTDNQNHMVQASHTTSVNTQTNTTDKFRYGSFTGTVKKITVREDVPGTKYILVENEAGKQANIVLTKNTFVLDNSDITKDAVITGYYNANAPMIMIYPLQYLAEVVIVNNQKFNVKVDIFDHNLISDDNTLSLNISPETKIVSPTGTPFTGDLAGHKLLVIYGPSTRSIPAQTKPDKIIVLSDKQFSSAADMNIIVNNQVINGPAAYKDDNGIIMVPLRTVAESLGFKTTWDNKLQRIMLNTDISMNIGEDKYSCMEGISQLGTAPALIDSTTYVPLSFFKQVVKVNRACISGTQIIIDNNVNQEVRDLTEKFGNTLQKVSLQAPDDIVVKSIKENYGKFVTPELLEKWLNNPQEAPGRITSSPWPERIEINSITDLVDGSYKVKGDIIELTSTEKINGGIAGKYPVTMQVIKHNSRWLINTLTINKEHNNIQKK